MSELPTRSEDEATTSACRTDTELLEYAEGLVSDTHRVEIAAHLDACPRCRAVLIAIARAGEPVSAPRSRPIELPHELLRAALRREAPRRERTAAIVMSALAVVSLATLALLPPLGERFGRIGMAIQLALLVYEVVIMRALRRGWFHAALPLVNALLETTVFMAMLLAAATTLPPELALRPPALLLIGGMLVFTSIRAEPRISLAAGIVAAVQYFALFVLVRESIVVAELPSGSPFATGVPSEQIPFGAGVVVAVFLLCCGAGGAMVSRYLVGQAEAALRAVREQDLFGKYLLHEPLGRGGMGEVLRATYCPEGGFTKTVAVKRLTEALADDEWFVESLRREARIGSTLAHPNLVQVLDCGRFHGSFVLVMEYVDGVSLSSLLARLANPLPQCAVAALAAELAAALAYVHARRDDDGRPLGLVHCDVNPPNVMVSRLGEVKLADFGVARVMLEHERGIAFAGKRPYAAPEQLAGAAIDGRTDLFALGLLLHEALTGERVQDSEGPRPGVTIEPPSRQRADVRPELDALTMSLLAEDPTERPATAAVVRETVLRFTGELAPYPAGVAALAHAADRALTAARGRKSKPSQ